MWIVLKLQLSREDVFGSEGFGDGRARTGGMSMYLQWYHYPRSDISPRLLISNTK